MIQKCTIYSIYPWFSLKSSNADAWLFSTCISTEGWSCPTAASSATTGVSTAPMSSNTRGSSTRIQTAASSTVPCATKSLRRPRTWPSTPARTPTSGGPAAPAINGSNLRKVLNITCESTRAAKYRAMSARKNFLAFRAVNAMKRFGTVTTERWRGIKSFFAKLTSAPWNFSQKLKRYAYNSKYSYRKLLFFPCRLSFSFQKYWELNYSLKK